MTNQQESREIEAREKQAVETEGTRPGAAFRPDVDIFEREDAFIIHADLPGADESSVDIHVDKGVLTLDAQPAGASEQSEAGGSTYAPEPMHLEYETGGYHRQFRISEKIDVSAVSGKMKDGVLEVVLPKSAQHQPRRIDVHAA